MNEFVISITIILGSILTLGLLVSPKSWKRGISQCFIYIFLYAFCTLPESYVQLITIILCAAMSWELSHAYGCSRFKVALFALCSSMSCYILATPQAPYALIGLVVYSVLLTTESRQQKYHILAATIVGTLLILWPACFYRIRITPDGVAWCLLLLFLANIFDAFSMLVGKAVGKHPLMPKVSPGKTWEGCIGGLIMTSVISPILFHQLELQIPLLFLLTLSLSICLLALGGDLLASIVKRQQGLKDYSRLIPGHGGLLDRFDSYLLSTPSLFLLILIIS